MMNALSGIGLTSKRTRIRMVERLRKQGIADTAVLAAMEAVPRHIFVEEALASRAYDDTALPLGFQQTISQPFIVARILELAHEGNRELGKTLEVGAGCAYQAAVLAYLANEVYAVERIAPLLARAEHNLQQLALTHKTNKIHLKHSDGMLGFPDFAPFNTIIVSAVALHIPQPLLEQLALGGRIVIPVMSGHDGEQLLYVIDRHAEGYSEKRLDAVRFVPLITGIEG